MIKNKKDGEGLMEYGECSTGIEYLDNLLGGLQIGDNLVWETDAGAYVDLFMEKFAHHSLNTGHNLIYVSFNRSPATIAKKLSSLPNLQNITLLDCFTAGKGDNDATFTRFYRSAELNQGINAIKIDSPEDVVQFRKILNKIEEEQCAGTRYIFDSVTGMQELWQDEVKTYRFFTHSCPRLYDLDTIAYWVLEKEVHTASFRANLEHITQISLEVSQSGGQLLLKVTKAENRYSSNMFKPQRFEVWNEEIVFREVTEKESLDLGGKVKSLRLKQGLTQTEFAKKINVTASYISQLERNLISPSIDSLILISKELQIEPGYFFSLGRDETEDLICRKNQRQSIALKGNANAIAAGHLLVTSTDNRRMQPMQVIIEPNTEYSGDFFDHRGDEFILVEKGELEINIDGESHLLREGDSLYIDSAAPGVWRNASEIPAQVIWILSPPST